MCCFCMPIVSSTVHGGLVRTVLYSPYQSLQTNSKGYALRVTISETEIVGNCSKIKRPY